MPAGVPYKQPRITEDDVQRVMKLHLQGVNNEAIKTRLGFSTATIREIVNVRRHEAKMEPVIPKKLSVGWTPPSTDLTKSRYSSKAMAKGAGA